MLNKIAVLGFGNILMNDDGLGPYVIQVLESTYEFGEGVSVLDIGTPGLGISQYLEGLDLLIVVDTVHAKGEPGEIRTYRLPDILKHAPGIRMSPHDPGLKDALLSLQFLGAAPKEVLLVGVIPEDVSMGTELTKTVRQSVPLAIAEVLIELMSVGVPIRIRCNRTAPDVWWQSAPVKPALEFLH
jgi:hydrogenase maturation protease